MHTHTTGQIILQIPRSLCPAQSSEVTNSDQEQPMGSHQINGQKTRHCNEWRTNIFNYLLFI